MTKSLLHRSALAVPRGWLLTALMGLLLSANSSSATAQTASMRLRPDWQAVLDSLPLSGIFLTADADLREWQASDTAWLHQRLCPASTYKVFNSLVILQEQVLRNECEVVPWDGVERRLETWNRDMDLRHALQFSAVWFYQEMARRVGIDRSRFWLSREHYGNANTGTTVDEFWLDGSLQISPDEQIRFLHRLWNDQLSFSRNHMRAVRDMMLLEAGDDWKLYGKTGWAVRASDNLGWFIGVLEHGDTHHYFVCTFSFQASEMSRYRKQLSSRFLRAEGWMQ